MRDALDNRNIVILRRALEETHGGLTISDDPYRWHPMLLGAVLRAMRKAGDEALFDQVHVRLERSFNAECDVRGGAQLVVPVEAGK